MVQLGTSESVVVNTLTPNRLSVSRETLVIWPVHTLAGCLVPCPPSDALPQQDGPGHKAMAGEFTGRVAVFEEEEA
jgi:hypothetical protein